MDMLGFVDQPCVPDRCRTCMRSIGNTSFNIFDHKILNISIVEILHSFTVLTFDKNDMLPNVVCQHCCEKLNKFYEFILYLEDVDTRFREEQKDTRHLSLKKDLKNNFHFQEVAVEYNLQENEGSLIKDENFEDENGVFRIQSNIFVGSGDTVELISPCSLKYETKQDYLCKLCNKCFKNERNFQRHNKRHENLTISKECAINNSNSSTGNREIFTSKECFICKYCSNSFNSKNAHFQHLETCANKTIYQTSSDQDSFNDYKTDCNETEVHSLRDNQNSEQNDPAEIREEEQIKCHICSLLFKSQISLAEHLVKSEVCKELNFINFKNDTKENHIEITDKEGFVCKICKGIFRNKNSMSAHMRKHVEKGRILSCTTCDKVFGKVNHLKRHQFLLHRDHTKISTNCQSKKDNKEVSTITEEGEFICEICRRRFKTKHSMSAHMRKHVEKGRVLSCLTCGKIFNKVSNLKEHQVLVHKDCHDINTNTQSVGAKETSTDAEEGDFVCEICRRRFKSKHSMSAHMRKHVQKGRVLSCPSCGKVFGKVSHLKRHQITHEDKRHFKCSVCNKSFSTDELLQQHSKQHKEAKMCPICQKAFTNMPALNTHIKIKHTRNKPYLCSYCGKRFDSSTNLNQHHKRHIGIKTFVCSLCPRKFVTKGELTSHTSTHTGERPHKCKQCNAVFTKNSSLVKHTYRHLGIKPYHCDTCFKKFTTKGSLKLHLRIHTGEKPYTCDICARSFTQSNDLVKHRRRHLGEKLFKCEQCTESFRLKTELKRHIAQHYVTHLRETSMAAKRIDDEEIGTSEEQSCV